MENKQDIGRLIGKFINSETVRALDRYFSEKSMMEILGVDRDENAHSNFLAWLFENEITGKEACRLLIELLKRKAEKEVTIPIVFSNLRITNVKVIREDFVCSRYTKDGKKISKSDDNDGQDVKGRADLLICINNGEAYIVIENKVLSEEECKWCSTKEKPGELPKKEDIKDVVKESLWQAQFYENYYSALEPYKDKTLFAFLTLPGKEKAKNCSFIHVTYQDIMDSILVPVLGRLALSNHPTEETQIKDYIKALGIRYSQDEVMAVDPVFKNLSILLWEENKVLFNTFAKVSDQNRDFLIRFWNENVLDDVALRDILRPTFEALHIVLSVETNDIYTAITKKGSDGKDRTNYYYTENGDNSNLIIPNIYSKNDLFRWCVEKYIQKNNGDINIQKLQRVFPPSLHGKTISARNKGFGNNHIITGNNAKKRFTRINNHEIYVCNTGWDGPAMMSRLIRYVETLKEFKDVVIQEIPMFLQKNRCYKGK